MMSDHDPKPDPKPDPKFDGKPDPWADLADSLGAKPANDSTPRSAAAAPASPARSPQKPRSQATKPVPANRSDWGDLASSLGLEAGKDPVASAQSQKPPVRVEQDEFSFGSRRPAAEQVPPPRREQPRPQRRDDTRDDTRDNTEGDRPVRPADERLEATGERGDSATPADGGPRPTRDDERGEGDGRRRRGRRGGRGRSGRGRSESSDRPVSSRPGEDDQTEKRRAGGGEEHATSDEPRAARAAAERGGEPRESDIEVAGGQRNEPSGDGDRDSEDAPRRRRRGRRGGRRRGRGEGEVGSRPQTARNETEQPRDKADASPRGSGQDHDEEPLPAGYGVRSATRPTEPGRPTAEGAETGEGSRAGEGQARRRRRRGSRGTSTTAEGGRRSSTTAEGGAEKAPASRSGRSGRSSRTTDGSGERRGRRSGSEARGSASTFDRGRRDEFAPVAGSREEDDEGLEFLGIEDAGHEGSVPEDRQDRHRADDDDSIIESGLNDVLDVPSWVEAIGIVIAGNLDARSRSPRSGEGGRGDQRGESSSRSGDRPRDSRRSHDQR